MLYFSSVKSKMRIVLVAVFLLGAGCTKKSKIDYNLDVNETLRWNVQTEPPSLDWILGTDTTSARIVDLLMTGLTAYAFKADEVQVVPSLATMWESSKDMKTWTFTLRQDVKWTDGVAFTAQQVLDGWERLMNPKTGAEYANFLFIIKNAQAYFEGKVKDFKDVGVSINEKGQIVVQLESPMSYFPSLLGHHSTYPIRKDVIEKHGDKWTEPENIVVLGPYTLKVWDHDRALVFERNESYFGTPAKIKNILGRVVAEQSTALNMFKKGELDALDEVPNTEIEKIKQMPEYARMPILAVYFYGMNVKRPPLDNVKVRRAINMAIDRDELNKFLGGEKLPAYNVSPPGLLGSDLSVGLRFNPEAARKLLDEAGFKDRSKIPPIQLGFNTSENHQRIAENIQAQLKRNLGIELQLANEEWKTYLKSLQAKNYQMYRMGWVADFPDIDTFINLFQTGGGNNHTLWSHKRYDEIVRLGASEGNRAKRQALYAEALKILNEEEVPMIPFYYYRDQYLINKRIKNYPMNVMHKFYATETEIVK